MYIRRTKINSRKDGKPYFTYRLVESVRIGKSVKQRTILNLGRHFPYPRDKWPEIASRIDDILRGQLSLFDLPVEIEKASQYYAHLIIQSRGGAERARNSRNQCGDYQTVDIDSLELTRPRSVGAEHVALQTIGRLEIERKLDELKFNGHQKNAAIGLIVGRIVEPGSELATRSWLMDRSGLGELLKYEYAEMSLSRMYRTSDMLLKRKEEIETYVYGRQKSDFCFEETITLYDLTNTFFEGEGKRNKNAKRGKSKEKRTDRPLVTLALVLDGSGFPKRSEVFEGNAVESKTLKEMLSELEKKPVRPVPEENQNKLFENPKPLVVMDAGIATEENVEWLAKEEYRYLVVSRKRHREFSEENSVEVKSERDYKIKVCKVENKESGEIELYCHSTRKEAKEKAISGSFSTRFEEELVSLNEGLSKKGCLKNHEKVIEKVGRLKQKYSKAAKNYEVKIEKHLKGKNAKKITWYMKDTNDVGDSHPGVYCLRTNWKTPDETTLWRTYTMLTDLEAVFRSLKSELGLRPVYHQTTDRVAGHLFITVLAHRVVHHVRLRLKQKGIHCSWQSLRKLLSSQYRVTATLAKKDGGTIHVRKTTKPEPMQIQICKALGISSKPGGTVKTTI